MSDRKLRVGVLGCGWQGGSHLRNFSAAERSELVAVCDIDESRAKEAAQAYGASQVYTDYEKMLASDDVDAVAIVIPDHLHREPAVATLQAGKHLLLEKPMATNVDDAQAIRDAAVAARGKFMLMMSNRWIMSFAKGKQLIDDGSIGAVKYASARLSNRREVPMEKLPWLKNSHIALWIGIHRLDIARWYIGSEVKRVRAVQRSGVLTGLGYDAPDFYQATFEFENGAVFNLDGSWILPPRYPALVESRFYAVCENGVIDIDWTRSQLAYAIDDTTTEVRTPIDETVHGAPTGLTIDATRHFINCCLDDQTPMIGADDGLQLIKALVAVVESAESDGKVIEL